MLTPITLITLQPSLHCLVFSYINTTSCDQAPNPVPKETFRKRSRFQLRQNVECVGSGGRVTQRHSWHSWLSAYKWNSWHTVCQLVNCVNCANGDPSSKRSPFAVAMKRFLDQVILGKTWVLYCIFSNLTVHSLVQYKTHPLNLGNFLEALNSI